jgi:amino acid permease
MVAAFEGSVFMFSMYSSLQEAKDKVHAANAIVIYDL